MNSIFETLGNFFRGPLDWFFSENGFIGSMWHESGRSRSLLLGLPSVLIALTGLVFLMLAQFGMSNSLESSYQTRLQESVDKKTELGQELQRMVKMKLASQAAPDQTSLDELVPRDNEVRVQLDKAREEERIYLKKLIDLKPEDNEYQFQLAKAMMGNKIGVAENEVGVAMMRRIAPYSEPGYIPAHLFLANWNAVMVRQDPTNARKHYKDLKRHLELILVREPKNEEALKRLGLLLYDERKFKDAQELFYRLFGNDPRQFKAITDVNTRLGQTEDNVPILRVAAEYLERRLNELTRDDDERTRVLMEITECYRLQTRWEDSEQLLLSEIEEYSKSKNDASRLAWVKRLLSTIYLSWSFSFDGNDVQSLTSRLEYLKKAFAYDSKNEECLKMLTRLGHSKFEEVATAASEVYDPYKHPEAPALVINELGIVALSESLHDEALKFFKKAAEMSSRNPEILNNLAYTYLKCSEPDAKLALSYINRAIQLTPASKVRLYRSNFFDTRARAYMQLGEYTAAIADLTKAWKDRSDNVAILEAIVYCHEQNKMMDASQVWRKRLEEARQKQAANANKTSPGDQEGPDSNTGPDANTGQQPVGTIRRAPVRAQLRTNGN